MGKESRRRARIARACARDDAAPPTRIHDIPDDILELTLLRIPSAVGIIRAAATCKLWRRVIGNAGFLRRFRRLCGLLIVGHHYYYEGSNTVFVLLPDAPAIDDDMSNSVPIHFVPVSCDYNACEWRAIYPELHDSRGGLLALYRPGFRIMVFCPWTRRSREVYAMMSEGDSYNHCIGVFLLDAAEPDETLAMSNFRVLYVHLIRHCHDGTETVQAWVFSARDHLWHQLGTSRAVGDIFIPRGISELPFEFIGRAGGSLCWCSKYNNNAVLTLDESTGEFSDFTLPGHAAGDIPYYDRMNLRVIGGDVDTVHLVRIVGVYDENDLELLRYARRGGTCTVDRRVVRVRVSQMASIDESRRIGRWWCFLETAEAAAPGRIVLRDNTTDVEYICKVSVDTKNIELERVQTKASTRGSRVFPYELPWTISVCL